MVLGILGDLWVLSIIIPGTTQLPLELVGKLCIPSNLLESLYLVLG